MSAAENALIEGFRTALKDVMAEHKAAAAQREDPNEERFARIVEAWTDAQKKGYEPGHRAARLIRAYLHGGNSVNGAMDVLKNWGSEDIVSDLEACCEKATAEDQKDLARSLTFNGPDGAALLVPEAYANELIPLLRPYSVLAKVVMRQIDLKYGTMHFNRISSASVSYWRPPQADNKKAGTPKFGRLSLQEKALTCIAVVPNRLLEVPGNRADEYVLMDILAGIGTNLDYAHFVGKGDEWEPLGYYNYPLTGDGAINDLDINGAFAWDLPIKVIEKHINSDGTMVAPVFTGSPTMWRLLMTATTGSAGFLAWLHELSTNKSILGIPFHYSRYIPVDSAGSKPTTLGLLDYMEFLFGVASNLRVSRSTEATVYDSAGNAYHLWPNNDTGIRAIWSGDMGLRQTKCCTVARRVNTV